MIEMADSGDSAVMVRAVEGDAELRWEVAHSLADAIHLDGVYGIVPAYDSRLVEFDCTRTELLWDPVLVLQHTEQLKAIDDALLDEVLAERGRPWHAQRGEPDDLRFRPHGPREAFSKGRAGRKSPRSSMRIAGATGCTRRVQQQ